MQESSLSEWAIPIPQLDDFENIETSCPYIINENVDDIVDMSERGDFVHITPSFLSRWINGDIMMPYNQFVVVDCRFDYEYRGGHIIGAINVNSYTQMMHLFKKYAGKTVAFIFHCEFSQDRGPNFMKMFRSYDRSLHTYPELTHKHLFLLSGGYSKFFQECSHLTTGAYIPMRDKNHVLNGDLKRHFSIYNAQINEPRYNKIQRFHSQGSIGISCFIAESSSFTKSFDDAHHPASQGTTLF